MQGIPWSEHVKNAEFLRKMERRGHLESEIGEIIYTHNDEAELGELDTLRT